MEEKIIDKEKAKEVGIFCEDFLFRVSSDDLFVYLEEPLLEEEEKKRFYENWEKIKDCLKLNGVQLVLDQPEVVEEKIIVAKAYPPKEGLPERIEFLPKFLKLFERKEESPEDFEKIEESEGEDLRERFQKIICAVQGEPIAKWYPSVPPTPGLNIWGDVIEPPPLSEEKSFELGENVYLDEKENLIKAKISGVVIYARGKIDISPEYVLKGDVDFSVGNIHFIGKKLTIQGDVKYGFTVECKGILELKGCTENKVTLKIEGSFISEGILRGEDTKIEVLGDARINGAEFSNILVKGNLSVKNYLIFTNTLVEGNLIVSEGKGLIYGGKVCALGNIEAKILGHPAQTKTEVCAGYLPEKVDTYLKLMEQEEIYLESLKKIRHGINLAEKLKKEGRFTERHEEILKKLRQEEAKIKEKLSQIIENIKGFKEDIENLRTKTVRVLQKIYPNVIIQIADITYTVGSEIDGPITFYLEEVTIKTRGEK